jgi:hypothetical protein
VAQRHRRLTVAIDACIMLCVLLLVGHYATQPDAAISADSLVAPLCCRGTNG